MSIFGAINTAASGLTAQSTAFSNLSNNIANSQTTGYKADSTSFEDMVTGDGYLDASAGGNDSVKAITVQHNDDQGEITTSTNSLALAISGSGFFEVAQAASGADSTSPTFTAQQYYTRDGDFSLNAGGYLVNPNGDFLEGYALNADGSTTSGTVAPIQVTGMNTATQSTTVSLTAAIGDLDGDTTSNTSSVTAYDASGNSYPVTLDWTQSSTNPLEWSVSADGSSASTAVTFNSDGSLASVNGNSTSGTTGSFDIAVDSSSGTAQSLSVDLGTIGGTDGVTLASSSSGVSTDPSMTTDSRTPTGLSITSGGIVEKTFSDGTTQDVAQIPLATFANVNGLNATDGQNFTATAASGTATVSAVGTGGAGSLSTGSLESSTTDLTGDLSQLIVAQQAYSANTKVVTTADQLMQTSIAMIQ